MESEKQIRENRRFKARMQEESSLSEDQQRAMAILSTMRHQMHSGIKKAEDACMRNFFLRNMPIMLRQVRLPELSLEREYSLYDTGKQLKEGRRVDAEDLAELLNDAVECWMRRIDEDFTSAYTPKGFRRAAYARTNRKN